MTNQLTKKKIEKLGQPISYKTFGFKSEQEMLEHQVKVLKEYKTRRTWSEEELRDLMTSVFREMIMREVNQ